MSRLNPDLLRERVARILELLEHDPDDGVSWFGLGSALIDLHRPIEAVDALRRAVELEPDHTGAHRELGRSLLESGDPIEAAKMFARAIGLAEKCGDVRTGRDIHQLLRLSEKTLPRN